MDFNPFKKKISELNILPAIKGKVLISEPFMKDPYFKRSVVFLCEKNEDGSVGFILNQPLKINLSEVLNEELGFDCPLFLGGPVEAQNLFYIHNCSSLPEAIHVSEDIYWSGDFELLKQFIKSGTILLHEVKFFLGYSGWDSDQMKDELKSDSWLISEISIQKILDTTTKTLWNDSLKEMGKEQAMFSTFPEDPSLN